MVKQAFKNTGSDLREILSKKHPGCRKYQGFPLPFSECMISLFDQRSDLIGSHSWVCLLKKLNLFSLMKNWKNKNLRPKRRSIINWKTYVNPFFRICPWEGSWTPRKISQCCDLLFQNNSQSTKCRKFNIL